MLRMWLLVLSCVPVVGPIPVYIWLPYETKRMDERDRREFILLLIRKYYLAFI